MKKKKEMDDLIIEISELSDQIEEAKKKNKKKRLHCNMEKIAALTKIGTAFTIVPLAGTLVCCTFGWNPFKLNDKKVSKLITTTIDRDGNEVVQEEYIEFKEENYFTLNYYTKWKENDNGNYIRIKYEYRLASETEINELVSLMKSGQDITRDRVEELVKGYLKDSIGLWKRYHSSDDEITVVIDEDYENKNNIEISWKKIDESDYIFQKEDLNKHVDWFLFYAFVDAFLMLIELGILRDNTYFFEHQKSKLNSRPDLINIRKLQRELDEKQRIFNDYQYDTLECDDEDILILDSLDKDESIQYKKQRLQ